MDLTARTRIQGSSKELRSCDGGFLLLGPIIHGSQLFPTFSASLFLYIFLLAPTDILSSILYIFLCFMVCILICMHAQSCSTLFNPVTIAHQAPLSMGISRQEYWSGLPFPPPEDLPDPGIKLCLLRLLHWQAGSLPLSHLGPLLFQNSGLSWPLLYLITTILQALPPTAKYIIFSVFLSSEPWRIWLSW